MTITVKNAFGLTEIATIKQKNIQHTSHGTFIHLADHRGCLLLTIDTEEQSFVFADPSVRIAHVLDGHVETFRGNYNTLSKENNHV